jgi:hypothetical protein
MTTKDQTVMAVPTVLVPEIMASLVGERWGRNSRSTTLFVAQGIEICGLVHPCIEKGLK